MRYRLLASYQGAPYEAGVGPQETGVVLFAACPPPEDLGFEPATGHWRKQVDRDDVQTLYESRPVGMFRGERCVVLDELNERLHIAYLGHDAYRAEQLGFWEVDRGVFELITPRQEVTEIVEQRRQVATPGEGGSYPQPAPPPLPPAPASGAPYGYDAGHGNGSRPGRAPQDLLTGPEPLTPGPAPVTDEHPLPLEAEAMRAARKAKESESQRDPGHGPAPAAPGVPPVSKPAGISEPSSILQPGETAASVPSWSPQPQVPPQRQASGAGQITESATGWPSVPESPEAPRASRAETALSATPPSPSFEPARAPAPAPAPVAGPVAGPAVPGQASPRPGSPSPVKGFVPAEQASAPRGAHDRSLRAGQPPASPGQPAASGHPDAAAGVASPVAGQLPGVSLQRPGPAIPAGQSQGDLAAGHRSEADDRQAEPGAVAPAGPQTQAVPHAQAGLAPYTGPQPPEPLGRLNGGYHSEPASHAGQTGSPPAAGLPRDQFERPRSAAASGVPVSAAPSGTAVPGVAKEPGSGVGVVIADPVSAFPYATAAPHGPPLAAAHPGPGAPQAAPLGQTTTSPAVQAAGPAVQAAGPADPADPAMPQPPSRRRRASRRRLPTQRIFSELAAQAGIPPGAYAINEDADGAMCLISTGEGFEVFNSLAGARHEVRAFKDEESAYFYLFGVLAAEAVRTGVLGPTH